MSSRSPSQELNSRWIIDFEKQVLRGKHVLLYGNVHDQFLWHGEYLTAQDFLQQYFLELRFEVVARYDPVDGLTFADEKMREKFNELVRQGLLATGTGVSGSGTPTPQAPEPISQQAPGAVAAQPPLRQRPGQMPAAQRLSGVGLSPEQAFQQLRIALSQDGVSIAAIVNLADMLTSDAKRYADSERTALMILKKALVEAQILETGPLRGYRNTLAITAGQLTRVPAWLYLENPFVSVVNCGRPAKEERALFLRSFHGGFYGGEGLSGDQLEKLCDEFADLTDGFQAWDLEALRRTGHVEKPQMPITTDTELRQLIDFFKFGLRSDPWEELNRERVANAHESLGKRVIGQEHAVEAVCRMLTSARVGLTMSAQAGRSAKPKGIFFFVGPTGVGKTELAKAMTALVFGDERAFARFDMSEYKEEHAAEKLAGAPPGFVGYESGGQLTNRVIERPHSILLFDEIEKAHPRVLDKFLQILEDGRLTDGRGQTAYFSQSAIIFTSNIGASELYCRIRPGTGDSGSAAQYETAQSTSEQPRGAFDDWPFESVAEFFREQVRDYFTNKINRAEIYNRLGDNIVPFDILRPTFVRGIGQKFLDQLTASAAEKYGLTVTCDESVLDHVAVVMTAGDNLLLGGRRIKAMLETLVEHPLSKWIFEHVPDTVQLRDKQLLLHIGTDGKLQVDWQNA